MTWRHAVICWPEQTTRQVTRPDNIVKHRSNWPLGGATATVNEHTELYKISLDWTPASQTDCMHCTVWSCISNRLHALYSLELHLKQIACTVQFGAASQTDCMHCTVWSCISNRLHALYSLKLHLKQIARTVQFGAVILHPRAWEGWEYVGIRITRGNNIIRGNTYTNGGNTWEYAEYNHVYKK